MSEQKIDIKELLRTAVGRKASDLHISVNHRPTLRVMGRLGNIPEMKIITPQDSKELAFALMTEDQQEKFMKEKEIDFSYDFENGTRFRVNVYQQRGTISCSLRIVPTRVSTLEELNLPAVFTKFTEASQGLVLVTGPSSHGKSTTLAAMLDRINRTQFKRIITIEDPIEYIFQDDKSIIDQREINYDTFSFRQALKSVFRQDPDIIMVGEMRDAETIATVITAAETGHLVFSTLHTNSAAETINRIIDSFPGDQQNQIRSQLASSLIGVISQRLISKKDGGLVAACEILMSTPATANIIRENRVHELDFVIETSAGEGMVSLNKALIHLIQKGKVSLDDALTYSRRPNELKKLIG